MQHARNGKGLACATSTGISWVWLVRLRERLPRLQRHLGGHAVLENSYYANLSTAYRVIFVGGNFRDKQMTHENNEN